jgi:hypothetical protein
VRLRIAIRGQQATAEQTVKIEFRARLGRDEDFGDQEFGPGGRLADTAPPNLTVVPDASA